MTPDSPILGQATGTLEEACAFIDAHTVPWSDAANVAAAKAYTKELFRLCPLVGIDPAVVFAQAAEESGNFLTKQWRTRFNATNLGITDSKDFGYRWDTPIDAARAQVVHLALYTFGLLSGSALAPYRNLDYRADAIPVAWLRTVRVLSDLVGKWATDANEPNDPLDYAEKIAEKGNLIFGASMAEYNFDPALVPFPPMRRLIVKKPYEGAGFTRVPFRGPNIVGVADHITVGRASIDWYFRFFSMGGERQYDALVDAIFAPDGSAAWLNDPYSIDEGGTRSPWASGGSDGLEGDGPAFVRTLGIGAINDRLVSKEHILMPGDPIPEPMFVTSTQFSAAVAQRSKIPFDLYPLNPNVGCVTAMQHYEFATKSCPDFPFRDDTDRQQDRVRAILKAAQVGESVPDTVPPPKPVENPGKRYPAGMNKTKATRLFGTLVRHNADETTTGYKFDENGTISNAWLERGAKEQQWPEADEWWPLVNSNKTVRQVVTFRNGWMLVHNADRRGWRWL